jgi:hypothetical protein
MVEEKTLDICIWNNILLLLELRDTAVHFYDQTLDFRIRLQEIGAACVKNFTGILETWFKRKLSEFDLYLMPLAFLDLRSNVEGIALGAEETNFLRFLEKLEFPQQDPSSQYSVTVNIEVNFTRSKAKDALAVRLSNEPNAAPVRFTEEQIREKYPWDYQELRKKCKMRYSNFKENKKFHDLRKKLENDKRFITIRFLDPSNPKSGKKVFFNPNILVEIDKHYTKN